MIVVILENRRFQQAKLIDEFGGTGRSKQARPTERN